MKAITKAGPLVLLAAFSLLPGPAASAALMFVHIDGIEGASEDPDHPGGIDVLSWSMGAIHSGGQIPPNGHARGGDGGAGKVDVQDMSFTKFVDKSSASIQQACANGAHFEKALLTVRKAGGRPVEYVTLNFTDLIVSEVRINGPSEGEDLLTENVTLNFRKVKIDYTPQFPDGSEGEPIIMEWDASTGSAR